MRRAYEFELSLRATEKSKNQYLKQFMDAVLTTVSVPTIDSSNDGKEHCVNLADLTNLVGLVSVQSSVWEDTLGYRVPWHQISHYFTQNELATVSQCSRRMHYAATNSGNSSGVGWRVHFVGKSSAVKPISTMVNKMVIGKFLSITMEQSYGAHIFALYSTPIANGVHTLKLFGGGEQQRFAWQHFKFPDLRRLRIDSKLLNETNIIDTLPQLDELTIHVASSRDFIPLKIGKNSPKRVAIFYPTSTEIGWWKLFSEENVDFSDHHSELTIVSAIDLLTVSISVGSSRTLVNHRIHEFLEGFHAYSPKTKIVLFVRGGDCTLDKVGDFFFAKYVTLRGWCKQFSHKKYKALKSVKKSTAKTKVKAKVKKVRGKEQQQQQQSVEIVEAVADEPIAIAE